MFDKIVAEFYDEVVENGYHDQKEYIKDLVEIIPKGSFILELGCGTGKNLIPLAKNGILCEGVDSSLAMLDKFKIKNKKIKTYLKKAKEFLPNKQYDYILSCNGPFSIKGDKIESYILEKENILRCIEKYAKASKNGLLINKGRAKIALAISLKNGRDFIHRESKHGDYTIMTNLLFEKEKFMGKRIFIKRRYPLKEIFQKAKEIKDFEHFKLVKF